MPPKTTSPHQYLIDQAETAGAWASEILVSDAKIHDIRVAPKSSPQVSSRQEQKMTVRVWLEGRAAGEASGRPEHARLLLAAALKDAETAPRDPFAGPVERTRTHLPALDIRDKRYDMLSMEDRTEVVLDNEQSASRVDRRVRPGVFNYEDRLETRSYLNSHGVLYEVESTRYALEGIVTLRGPEPPVVISHKEATRSFSTISTLPFGTLMGRRLVALAGRQHGLSGDVRVLFPPLPMARIVAWLGERFAEESLQAGSTLLRDGDSPVQLSPAFHIIDDGASPGALRTRGFDDAGVLGTALPILQEGVFNGPYLSPAGGRAMNLPPTGHVFGDTLRAGNLQMNTGTRSMNAHMGEMATTVFRVDDLWDLSGLDPATGEMDVPVHGQVFDAQDQVGVIRHARLKGNLIEALQNIAAVTSDTDRYRHVDAAGVFVDGLRLERP